MALTMSDPRVKVQLFRFIDALPTLTTPRSVRRHLDEYLGEAAGPSRVDPAADGDGAAGGRSGRGPGGPRPVRLDPDGPPVHRRLDARRGDRDRPRPPPRGSPSPPTSWARRSSPRPRPTPTSRPAWTSSAGSPGRWPPSPRSRRSTATTGPIPRANLSLKLTSLTPRFDALHAETTAARVLARLRPILRAAREVGAFVNVDMEQYAHKDLTYAIFRSALDEPEFRDWPDAGIVAQAYLPEARAT